MKKNILFIALAVVAIFACTILTGDGLIYLMASLILLTIIGLIRGARTTVMKATRWAKANPGKAQWLIAGLYLSLLGLGVEVV